jgi:uncharacterized protein (TIGR03382 family)
MSKRWLGLLLLVMTWIGGEAAARAAGPVITVTPDPLVAGTNTAAGSTSTGSSTITTDTPVVVTLKLATGADCSQFAITSSTSLTLDQADSPAQVITVSFTPTTAGTKSCTVNVLQNTTILKTFGVTATATGTPQIGTSPATLDFAHEDVKVPSTAQTVTVQNLGTDTLTITGTSIVTQGSNYQVNLTTGTTSIPPGGSSVWSIACNPQTAGAVNDTFRIVSNDPVNGTVDTPLKCFGDQGTLTVDPASLPFDAVSLGGQNALSLTLTNTGNVTIDNLAAALDKTNIGYSVAPLTKTSLAAGEFETVTVTFAPTKTSDGGPAVLTLAGKWGKNDAQAATITSALSGQTIALAFPTITLPFGDFRFDSPRSLPFEIQNNGSADIQIAPFTFTADMGTTAAEVTTTVMLDGNPVDLSTTQTLPHNQKFVVTVTVTPANRTGAIGGKIIIHAPIAGFVDKTITVTGNAQAAVIATANVDFGAVDVASTTTMTLTATIKNTGNATLDISPFNTATTTPAGVFTLAPPAAITHLAPGDTLPITVTYQPKSITTIDNPDKLTLTADLTGALNGPAHTVLTVQGRGIGRNLVVPQAQTAPTTFRNPGTLAPVIPVTITNTGEAVLHITAAMVADGAAWSLVDTAAVDVPGGGTHDFQVKFAPTDIGANQTGQLVLTSLDNTNAPITATIPLTGTAEARNVAFGPAAAIDPNAPIPVIDVGVTGVNLPITLADALKVTNLDPGNPFTIHQITLDDATNFTIEDAPKDQALPASAAQGYAVQFAPTARGDFAVTATLFLDQDPVPHAKVMITGTADAVEAHGGGGCNAGSSGTGGLGLGLAALGVLRRRRARASRAVAS